MSNLAKKDAAGPRSEYRKEGWRPVRLDLIKEFEMKVKLFKSLLLAGLMSCALCFAPVQVAFGEEVANVAAFDRRSNSYVIDGNEVKILDTFVNADDAIVKFKSLHSDFVSIARESGLPELSEQTAGEYKALAFERELDLRTDEYGEILSFLDILENKGENQDIRAGLDAINASMKAGSLSVEEAAERMSVILPIEDGDWQAPIAIYNSGINLSAANAYASRYATKPNVQKYGYEIKWGKGVDCTNFASQILHAGGVGMVSTGNVNSGWWFNSVTQRSTSWIQAGTFARYMGMGYSNSFWTTFKNNVRAGDFIGFDSGGDGVVDHIGYVTAKSGGSIKIAQHSTDYHLWDGDTGWSTSISGGGKFYRIRR